MKYYQEITLLPAYDVPVNFIWSKVYPQIHLAFVSYQNKKGIMPFGVSLPEYGADDKKKIMLGNKLRIFSTNEDALAELDVSKWLSRLEDYVHLTGARPVPAPVKGYSIYGRYHQEGSIAQKARRFAKRHAISYEESEKLFPKKWKACMLPYVQLQSMTNHNMFRLFIGKKSMSQPVQGEFGSYGLSNQATVPEF